MSGRVFSLPRNRKARGGAPMEPPAASSSAHCAHSLSARASDTPSDRPATETRHSISRSGLYRYNGRMKPLVGIIMGSSSDWETMQAAADMLDKLSVPYETRIVSAHRTPDLLFEYASTARSRG